jgi:hypothetical protein
MQAYGLSRRWNETVSEPKLHLDADTSRTSLWRALLNKDHDVTRTPNDWMHLNASDEEQLLGATAMGRCIFTFNIRDFMSLAKEYPHHGGIIFSSQKSMPELFKSLDRLLLETKAEDWPGNVRWLTDWIR